MSGEEKDVINATSNNEEQKEITAGNTRFKRGKSSPTKRDKNHGHQPTKLHYIESVYKHHGLSYDTINPRRRLTRSIYRRQQ
jgi:hypothetical protein